MAGAPVLSSTLPDACTRTRNTRSCSAQPDRGILALQVARGSCVHIGPRLSHLAHLPHSCIAGRKTLRGTGNQRLMGASCRAQYNEASEGKLDESIHGTYSRSNQVDLA